MYLVPFCTGKGDVLIIFIRAHSWFSLYLFGHSIGLFPKPCELKVYRVVSQFYAKPARDEMGQTRVSDQLHAL
jgi:hypothetical protein